MEGKVVDNFKQPIKGIEVTIEGMSVKSVTDDKGEYSIPYFPGKFKLKYSGLHYESNHLEMNVATKETLPAETITMFKYPPHNGLWIKGEKDYKKIVSAKIERVKPPKGGVDYYLISGDLNFNSSSLGILDYFSNCDYFMYSLPITSPIPLHIPSGGDVFFGPTLDKKKIDAYFPKGEKNYTWQGGSWKSYNILVPVSRRLDQEFSPNNKCKCYIIARGVPESKRAKFQEDYDKAILSHAEQVKREQEAKIEAARKAKEAKLEAERKRREARVEAERRRAEARIEAERKMAEARTEAAKRRKEAQANARLEAEKKRKAAEEKAEEDKREVKRAGELNNKAWTMATSKDASKRNPTKALAYAKEARAIIARIGRVPYQEAYFVSTMAAALAVNGRYHEAITYQHEAIHMCQRTRRCKSKIYKDMQRRLSLYEKYAAMNPRK